jgi:cell division protease FtsH
VHQVSIIPRGMAGGYTMSLPTEDRSYHTRKEMLESIIVLLAGRSSETLVLDDISTGASNDIERATATARAMIMRYGFSEKLGPIVYGHDPTEIFLGRSLSNTADYSDKVAAEIDEEVRKLICSSFARAKTILTEHRDQLDLIANMLLKLEKLDGVDFESLMKTGEMASEDARREALAIRRENGKYKKDKKPEAEAEQAQPAAEMPQPDALAAESAAPDQAESAPPSAEIAPEAPIEQPPGEPGDEKTPPAGE